MKAIKNQIIMVLSTCAILAGIISLSIFVQACGSRAEAVVNSPSHQAYEDAIEKHSKNIRAAFRALSDEKRKEVDELLNDTIAGFDELAKVGTIVGYDIEAGLTEIKKLCLEVESLSDVAPEEYAKAVGRKSKNNRKANAAKNEKGESDAEKSEAAYVSGCTFFYMAMLRNNLTQENAEFREKMFDIAGDVWIKGLANCEKKYR